MKKTHTRPLSNKEIEILRNNPNVKQVSSSTVIFTEGFLEKLYTEKCRGIPIVETLRMSGINPEILGESRLHGLTYTLNKKARKESGFTDLRSENYRHPPKTGNETLEQRIKQLENELAYTRQEVEF